ncbi:MAG: hypothetical protein Q9M19_02100 [Mariprofundaceae bacterium]|nr:hypothetical protein [Mariprofundaceae bacterium]
MDYKALKEIDARTLAAIEIEWLEQLEVIDINPARCLGALSRATKVINGDHNNQFAYVHVSVSGSFNGIVLMSHALPKSNAPWLKVLELTLAPTLVDEQHPTAISELTKIGSSVIDEVFTLSIDKHKSESVKIYGDSIMDVRMWREAITKLKDAVGMPYVATSHGRWLVLEKKEGSGN